MYAIYTGYVSNVDPKKYAGFDAETFFKIWYKNTRTYVSSEIQIKILGPEQPPDIELLENVKQIATYPNLGHIGDYIHKNKEGLWCGWTAGIVLGMIDAYVNEIDFVYKEQDCLAFGDYISSMYGNDEDFDIVYGECKLMGVAQSLFLVKRNAIPKIIASLAQEPDVVILPEDKFLKLPVKQKRLSFGYDRDRPFNPKDPVFYIQQLSKDDYSILERENLV